MAGYRPNRPPENVSKLHSLLAIAWDYLLGGKFPFIDTDTVRWTRTEKGYAANVPPPNAAGKTTTAPSSMKEMCIIQLGSSLAVPNYDLLICNEWDPVANGIKSATPIYVAKTIEARRGIVKEYFLDNGDNITQTYAYFTPTAGDASYGDNFRLGNDGTNTELQAMEKRYYAKSMIPDAIGSFAQCLVYVVDTGAPTGVKDPNGADVTRIEHKPFREWARYATQ